MARFLYILLVIVLFGVLIAIHEFGHFITAKLLGVKVNEFAIGMGPAIWQSRKGTGEPWEEEKTLYSLRAFPVGGYCAMEGEDEDTGDPRAFSRQKGWKKIIILCAGAAMNFLTGLVIIAVLYAPATGFRAEVYGGPLEGYGTENCGLLAGDRFLSVDGHRVLVYGNARFFLDRAGLSFPQIILDPAQYQQAIVVINSLPVFFLTTVVTIPVTLWLLPYQETARAGFYDFRLLAASDATDRPDMPPL